MPFDKTCTFCSKPFVAVKSAAKFCSAVCFGKSRTPFLVQRNKSRRKYPEIEGLTRYQSWYRGSNKIDRLRDVNKRQELLTYLGGKCVQCGYDKDLRGLVLDHIHGDGSEDRKKRGAKIFRYYLKNLEEANQRLQVLCATCNQIKAFENNEHNRTKRVT